MQNEVVEKMIGHVMSKDTIPYMLSAEMCFFYNLEAYAHSIENLTDDILKLKKIKIYVNILAGRHGLNLPKKNGRSSGHRCQEREKVRWELINQRLVEPPKVPMIS